MKHNNTIRFNDWGNIYSLVAKWLEITFLAEPAFENRWKVFILYEQVYLLFIIFVKTK